MDRGATEHFRVRLPVVRPSAFAAFSLAMAWFCVALDATAIRSGNYVLGKDFAIYWTAGQMASAGHALDVFYPARLMAWSHRLLLSSLGFHMWSYPPSALLNVLWAGRLSYRWALAAWEAGTLAALILAARAFLGRWNLALAVALSPAAICNIEGGQNGALTSALMLAGLAALRTRPGLAGVAFGFLGFKPQIGFLLPLATLIERRWRTIAVAAATGVAVAGLSLVVFGPDSWRAFLQVTVPMQSAMMVGTGPFRWFAPTGFMAGLILFGPGPGPLLVQAPFTVAALILTWRAFKSDAPAELKAAALVVCTILGSPQAFNYDMAATAAAALILLRHARDQFDRYTALGIWATPFLVLTNAVNTPIAPLVLLAAALRLDGLITQEGRADEHTRLSLKPYGRPDLHLGRDHLDL